MRIKMNNTRMDSITDSYSNYNNELKKEIDNLLVQINNLEEIWQGSDADEFFLKAKSYINFIQAVPDINENLCNYIKNLNNQIRNLDVDYSNIMKKAVVENE